MRASWPFLILGRSALGTSASTSRMLSTMMRNSGSGPIGGGNGNGEATAPTLAVLLLTRPATGEVSDIVAGCCPGAALFWLGPLLAELLWVWPLLAALLDKRVSFASTVPADTVSPSFT